MTEKKLTESEIMKALELCFDKQSIVVTFADESRCVKNHITISNILALINRKNAEIERLQGKATDVRRKALMEASSKFSGHSNYHGDTILCTLICMAEGKEVAASKPIDYFSGNQLKAEAIKEFAERVKTSSNVMELVCSGALVRKEYTITEESLDQIAKEMGVEL